MDFQNFVQWGFYAMISGTAVVALSILQKMRDSIEELNKGVAELVGKDAGRERELNSHNERITRLESQVRG